MCWNDPTAPAGACVRSKVNECTMEAGANFITDAYRIIPGLAGEMGIPLQAVCRDSAIAIDEAIRAFRADRPATAIKAGILSLRTVIGGFRLADSRPDTGAEALSIRSIGSTSTRFPQPSGHRR